MSKCIYCGIAASAGQTCRMSPTKGHVVIISGLCVYCGTRASAGQTCRMSPTKGHVIGVL